MKDKIISIVSILAIALVALLMPLALVNDNVQLNQNEGITVSGTSTLEVVPDEATVYLEINTLKDTAKEAEDENTRISNSVKQALIASGIKEDSIETSNYYLYDKTEWDYEAKESKTIGYELRHTLKVKTSDIKSVGGLVDKAIEAGANGVDRVQFGLSNAKEMQVKEQAILTAIEAAEKKANSMASKLNVKVGEVKSISENNMYYSPVQYSNYKASGAFDESSNSISPSKVDVQMAVQLVYDIE